MDHYVFLKYFRLIDGVMNKTMKKLLLLLLLLLTGCGYRPMDVTTGAVISDVESYNDGCLYYSKTTKFHNSSTKYNSSYFFDRCGKFTVGDTIKVSI